MGMSNIKHNEATIRELYAAINNRDLSGILHAASSKIEYIDYAFGRTVIGKDAFREYWHNWLTAFRDGTGKIQSLLASGDTVVVEVQGRGTQTGPLVTPFGRLEPSGRTFEFQFCQVFHLKDGKIVSGHSYYDASHILLDLTRERTHQFVA